MAGILPGEKQCSNVCSSLQGDLMILVLLLIKPVTLYGVSQEGPGALPKAVNALSSVVGC